MIEDDRIEDDRIECDRIECDRIECDRIEEEECQEEIEGEGPILWTITDLTSSISPRTLLILSAPGLLE
jgi:hypothetical protein